MNWKTFAKTVLVPVVSMFLFNMINALMANWGTLVSLLGPHFAFLSSSFVVAFLTFVAHQMHPTLTTAGPAAAPHMPGAGAMPVVHQPFTPPPTNPG